MLIGKQAPVFSCKAVIKGEIKQISLESFPGIKVLFFYPSDFTFVCPTELHALQDVLAEFQQRNTTVLAISTDSINSHCAWLEQPKKEGGIQGITYPLLADFTKAISSSYGVLNQEEGVAYRGMFLIDQNSIIQAVQIYNLPLGRNIAEILRLIDAMVFAQEHGEVCPANWQQGEEAMEPSRAGVKSYLSKK